MGDTVVSMFFERTKLIRTATPSSSSATANGRGSRGASTRSSCGARPTAFSRSGSPGRSRRDHLAQPARVARRRHRDAGRRRHHGPDLPDELPAAALLHHRPLRSKAIFVENGGQLDKVMKMQARPAGPKKVIVFDADGVKLDDFVMSWDELLAAGFKHADANPKALEERIAQVEPEDLATLVYTSGTTGPPKGAMLTHANIVWTCGSLDQILHGSPDDRKLSYLPLSHIAERMVGHFTHIYGGGETWFAESIDTFARTSGVQADDLLRRAARLGEVLRRDHRVARRTARRAAGPRAAGDAAWSEARRSAAGGHVASAGAGGEVAGGRQGAVRDRARRARARPGECARVRRSTDQPGGPPVLPRDRPPGSRGLRPDRGQRPDLDQPARRHPDRDRRAAAARRRGQDRRRRRDPRPRRQRRTRVLQESGGHGRADRRRGLDALRRRR